jgi:hypothetical protein
MRRDVMLGLVVALLVLVVAVFGLIWWSSDGRWTARPVSWAESGDNDTDLILYDGCFPEMRASSLEGLERVVVALETTGDRAGGDCAGAATVTLSEPLGDRVLVDQATGEPIEVRP